MELNKKESLLIFKLQTLDLKIFFIENNDIEKTLNEILSEIKKIDEEIKKLSNEIKEKELKVKNIEGEIAELNKKSNKLKETLSLGKKLNEKEFISIQNEINKIQNLKNKYEEEIIVIDELIEKTKDKLNKEKENLNSKKIQLTKEEERTGEEKEKLKIEKDQFLQKRKALIKEFPEELLNFYQSNIHRFGRKIISVVKDDKCSECGMILPYGMISILKNSEKSINCESCGRFLILEKEVDLDL